MTRPVPAPALLRLGLGVALLVSGCANVTPDATPALVPSAGPSPTVVALPSPSPDQIGPSASPPSAETHPPPATLVDADGREVRSQIGTFVWQGVVSDSPLLPGAAATVRAGQTLPISVVGPRPTNWVATLYSDPADPGSARGYGQGKGVFTLVAPGQPGAWTLRLKIVYAVGEVTHYWRVTVTE